MRFIHLGILLLCSLLFCISTLQIKNSFIDILSSVSIYFALICSRLFRNYILDVTMSFPVLLGNIFLVTFVLLYSSFFLLKYANDIVANHKLVRRIRNEEKEESY